MCFYECIGFPENLIAHIFSAMLSYFFFYRWAWLTLSALCFVTLSFMVVCNQTAVLLWINNSCDFTRCYCTSVAVFQDVIWPESMNQQQNE